MNRKERRARTKLNRKAPVASPSVAPGFEQRVAEAIGAVLHNQTEIARTLDSHDAQLAVLTRIALSRLNELAEVVNTAVNAGLKTMVFEDVSAVFNQLSEFRKRKDYRLHNRKWFMGEDVSSEALGSDVGDEVGETVASPEAGTPEDSDAQYPDGALIFGGDYAEAKCCEDPACGGEEGDDVPALQAEDDVGDQPSEQEAGAVLPEVP